MFLDEFTPETAELRKKFNSLRGATVSAFAHTEFLMKAFLVAFAENADFENSGGYYNTIEGVAANFRLLFENPNFENSLRKDVHFLIDNFEKVIDDRHQFVHGIARLDSKKRIVEMHRYRPIKGQKSNNQPKYLIISKIYDLDSMEDNVKMFDEICRGIIGLILDLDQRLSLGITSNSTLN